MRLIGLEMQNFRQHVESKIEFTDGLTGIIGTNGSGKSTILEAIAWALYGANALRKGVDGKANENVRATASEGGGKVSATLTFELGGTIYRATRTLDASGRSGGAVLEVDGKPLRSGMTEVTGAVAKLLGMDYQAFFTSFFTGQKQLEFMSQLDGRARAVAISRMLGYDRLTKARDQANDDRKGLNREIEGLERGLPDPELLKIRKKEAQANLATETESLKSAESAMKSAQDQIEKLRPQKEISDQKSKRFDETSRRLEIDRAELARHESRLKQLRSEIADLDKKKVEFDALVLKFQGVKAIDLEYKLLADLQKFEPQRQQLAARISSLNEDIKRLELRLKQLSGAEDKAMRADVALNEALALYDKINIEINTHRESKIAKIHGLKAQISQHAQNRKEIESRRIKIAEAGEDGRCPTCERALGEELPTVLANFDAQIRKINQETDALEAQRSAIESNNSEIDALQKQRDALTTQIEQMRAEKMKADSLIIEMRAAKHDLDAKSTELASILADAEKIPSGFDHARFSELQQIRDANQPDRERGAALRAELQRAPVLAEEASQIEALWKEKTSQIEIAEKALAELAFSADAHANLTRDFDLTTIAFNEASILVERERGAVNTASAILAQIKLEEDSLKSKLEELKDKKNERLHLQALAEAFDKLRTELNDRIRPELETIASELLGEMTDGRYNTLEINDNYQAMIRDDGELKPVISGGEDDIVNLALRLAISQMIADRAGQSFSLLVLDEVFGSLDDTRRDNVVSLLSNLKNRFEQIILITHVESIHDALDNCLWVSFEEKTKTSRLIDRSKLDQPEVGALSTECE